MRIFIPLIAAALLSMPVTAQTPPAISTPVAPVAPAVSAPSAPAASAPTATAPVATAPAATAPTSSAQRARPTSSHQTLEERFAKANTTHDGKLTPAQAKAGLRSVARRFATIDKDKKGYVTIEDIRAYDAERTRVRAAIHAPAPPRPPTPLIASPSTH